MNRRSRVACLILALGLSGGCAPAPDGPSGTDGGSARLSELLGAPQSDGFARAIEPRAFEFPADHGPHPAYRNEWWYLTGNLDGDDGRRFGYELTLFRFSLTPGRVSTAESRWRSNQVYIGHFAITDVAGRRFVVAQRFSRDGAGLAGARHDPFRVWLDDWSVGSDPGGAAPGAWRVRAGEDDVTLDLELVPLKPPVLNGADGLSQKSAEPGNASYYYSIPRLATRGTLAIDGRQHAVEGLSWLDREWGSSALSSGQRGWDWFALQLEDGSDLMFYQIRRNDGEPDVHSAGTWIPPDGAGRRLDGASVSIEVLDHWDSPAGGRYPMGWRLRVAPLELDLEVSPVLEAQELSTMVRYWEGAVDVSGTLSGRNVDGRGYVELTGYATAATAATPPP